MGEYSLDDVKLAVKNIFLRVRQNEQPVTLLDKVSLTAVKGEIHTLLGPSGSGKSTLLYTLNRLREIDAGEILLDGINIQEMNVYKLRRRVGLMPQQPVFFPGSIGDNILYGPRLRLNTSQKISDLPDPADYLEAVGLERNWADRKPDTLSGGQQQRVSLARLLANQSEVLLLDEPTSALDAQASEILEKLLKKLCREKDITVIWVTHSLEQAKRIADRTTLLYQGEVVEEGKAEDFFSSPKTKWGRGYLTGTWGGEP